MTINQRHELQTQIAVYNVLEAQRRQSPSRVRSMMAYWIKQARKLRDDELIRVARTI